MEVTFALKLVAHYQCYFNFKCPNSIITQEIMSDIWDPCYDFFLGSFQCWTISYELNFTLFSNKPMTPLPSVFHLRLSFLIW